MKSYSSDAGRSARQQYRLLRAAGRRRRATRMFLAAGALALMARGLVAGRPVWAVAGVVVGFGALVVRVDRDPQRWLRGAVGEERSAALLAQMGRRWHALHDRAVPGFSINVDHVVIGPTGVWVVDTKTYRAPLRGRWHRVDAGGHPIDTGPVTWEAELVSERLGVTVTPIVAVHGVGLSRRGRRCDGVRVVPAAALVSRLRRGRRVLDRQAVEELATRAEQMLVPRARG